MGTIIYAGLRLLGLASHIRKELAFRKFRSIWVPGFIIHKAPSGPLTNVDQPLSDLVEAYHTGIEARFPVYNDDNT